MSDFSDVEDHLLFQLVKAASDSGEQLSWKKIAEQMKKTKKSQHAIRIRFKTLKRTYGSNLDGFPRRFYRALDPATSQLKTRQSNKKIKKNELKNFTVSENSALNASKALLMLSSNKESVQRSSSQVHDIVYKLFNPVRKSDLRQRSGEEHLNCGEVTVEGVTNILQALGDVNHNDRFADIGSGIGNILAQVALESPVRMCFGIDCQTKVVKVGKKIIREALHQFPELAKVSMSAEDITAPKWHTEVHLRACTILYSNNLLFESVANLQLEDFASCENHVRYVILLKKFCYRHRMGCQRKFCTIWSLTQVIKVSVHWSSSMVDAFVFERKKAITLVQ